MAALKLLALLFLLWCAGPSLLRYIDGTSGSIDQSIWLLVLLSLISFLVITGLCWWLLQRFWNRLQLPVFSMMVLQFHILPVWQQISFFLASFALLLLAATGSLIALC